METGSLTAVQIILLVLCANFLLILSAYGLIVWWRRQSREIVQVIGDQIREFDAQIVQLAGFLQAFSGINQEPYFSPLKELQAETDQLSSTIQLFLETCQDYETEINQPEGNQLLALINSPIIWFRRWRLASNLKREGQSIASQIRVAEQRMENIYELPWELANECRKASPEIDEFAQHIQWFQSKGTRGASFQKIASQLPIMQQFLQNIPVYFLSAGKEDLLSAANMQSTIKAFQALNNLRPVLERCLPQVRGWRTNLEQALAEYAEMKQAGANLRTAMTNPTPGVNVQPLQSRIDQVAQMATEINQRLSQPDVEAIKPLGREISQIHKVIKDAGQQYQRSGQQVIELRQSIMALHDSLNKLSVQVKNLETRTTFPIAWDTSAAAIVDLSQKLHALGPVQQPRTPDEIIQQQVAISVLQPDYQKITQTVSHIVEIHTRLISLLESPDLVNRQDWMQKTRETLKNATIYDTKNWGKKDILQMLPGKLDEIAKMQAYLVPTDMSAPLLESSLAQRLEETQELARLYKELRPLADSLSTRLENIQALESESKDRISGAWSALEKVDLLSESNPLLEQIIAGEFDELGNEIRQLANDLNNRGQGEIEKKAQRIESGYARVNQALSQWVARLQASVSERARLVNDRLIQIDAVAILDEPPVTDARTMLQREDIVNLLRGPQPAQRVQTMVGQVTTRITQSEVRKSPIELDAIADIKRKNDLWQTLTAVQQALEEKTDPVLAAHMEIVQARDDARRCLSEINRLTPEKRSWPPHNQAPLAESQTLQPIDEKWEFLKKKPSRAEWLILELSRLAQQYGLSAERANQLINRIQQDQERVQDLEWQISEVKQRWQAQADPSNPILREGIQQLVSLADSRLAYIKQQYMRGVLSYEQTLQNMQLLYNEIFTAQAPVDENNKIGLKGNYHRSRKN